MTPRERAEHVFQAWAGDGKHIIDVLADAIEAAERDATEAAAAVCDQAHQAIVAAGREPYAATTARYLAATIRGHGHAATGESVKP